MVGSGNVENFKVIATLTENLSAVDKPLVAVFINGWIGHGRASKGSLKIYKEKIIWVKNSLYKEIVFFLESSLIQNSRLCS